MSAMITKLKSGGMTLVELMVALAITALVLTLSVAIFSGQIRSYNRGRETKEIQETNQESVEILRRDLAQAGWSVKPEMGFYFQDGGNGASDRIYVNDTNLIGMDFDKMDELNLLLNIDTTECAGCAQILAGNGTNSVQVSKLDIDLEKDKDGNTKIDFYNATQFVISDSGSNKVAEITGITEVSSTLSLGSNLSGNFLSPAIYYCVDDGTDASNCHTAGNQWVLRRSDTLTAGNRQPLANNVVDLQVAYQDSNGYWYGLAGCSGSGKDANGFCDLIPFSAEAITLIRLTLVTRSDDRVGGPVTDPKYCRPAAENRTAAAPGSTDCGYVYRTHTTTIQPRNIRR